jgi:hypothetical protein
VEMEIKLERKEMEKKKKTKMFTCKSIKDQWNIFCVSSK